MEKGKPQQEEITMSVCEEIGHDHNGQPIYRFDKNTGESTNEIWDDSDNIIKELDNPSSLDNDHVFQININDIKGSLYVPRYYWKRHIAGAEEEAKKQGFNLITVEQLINEGILESFAGHGSPKSEFKGRGEIPYVRVADIVNWSIYKNPTSLIPKFEYDRVKKNGFDPREKDVLFVRRGSYRIGSVAILSEFDTNILLTKEIQTFRIAKADNKYGLDAFYLLYLFSHAITQKQLFGKIMIDTTLPNIGDRWKELKLPIMQNTGGVVRIRKKLRAVFQKKWESQKFIEEITKEYGQFTT